MFISDNKGKQIDNTDSDVWYHGSPYRLEVLKASSSITRNIDLAIAFSYKPTMLSVDDDGKITHNGTVRGYLYKVCEQPSSEDIEPHQACSEDDQWEFITKRELSLEEIEICKE